MAMVVLWNWELDGERAEGVRRSWMADLNGEERRAFAGVVSLPLGLGMELGLGLRLEIPSWAVSAMSMT